MTHHILAVDFSADTHGPLCERLVALLENRGCVVLSGAGCSTESGIPDYRGAGRPTRSAPIQHREFLASPEVRRRYWARATLGWARFSVAQPNRAHVALAQLENAGVVSGIITQNVDRLHQRAGSRHVVELHGALADVVCLDCLQVEPRDLVHQRLLEQNPQWLESTGTIHPDGDADLSDRFIGEFRVAACRHCGGTLKPDVVFFGGSVARPTLERALDLLAAARVLLVVGTSLAVFSGYRFVKRAAENGLAIAVINLGPTRADALPIHTRLEARAGEILPRVARALVDVARDVEHSEESRRDRGAL